MAVTVINPRIYFAQYHLSADHGSVDLTVGYREQVTTAFTHTAERSTGTIPFVEASGSGWVTTGTGAVHNVLRNNLATADIPITIAETGGVDGSYAEFFKAMELTYLAGGPVGSVMPFAWSAKGQGTKPVKGTILGTGSKTTTANGTARQLGAVSATQRVYGVLHVISVSGTNPTLNVVIASDNAEGFSSGTTQLTFAQKTAAGSEFISAAGAIADDWWRAQWTIGGTNTPTFDVVVVVGIA